MPSPGMLRPEWKHRELVLPIGDAKYRFRTLSLYDVWTLWPLIQPMHDAASRGKPLAFAGHLEEVLGHLCPDLKGSDDFKKIESFTLDALIEFYERQDWSRIKALVESLEGDSAAPEDMARVDAERNFFTIVTAAARMAGTSVVDFVDQRFEFCADAFMTLHAAVMAERKGGSAAEFFQVMGAFLPAETPSNKPAWIAEIEKITGPPGVQ